MKTVLVPVSRSVSPSCVAYAGEIARLAGAKLVFFHVSESGGRSELVRTDIEPILKQHHIDARVICHISNNDPAREIARMAMGENADLLIMQASSNWRAPLGWSDNRAFHRFSFHSILARSLESASCPVLVLPPDFEAKTGAQAQPAICMLNRDARDERLLLLARSLAGHTKSVLFALHGTLDMQISKPGGSAQSEEWNKSLVKSAKANISQMVRQLGLEAEILVEPGQAVQLAQSAAMRLNASLIVLANHDRQHYWESANQAFQLIRASGVPILVCNDTAPGQENTVQRRKPTARPKTSTPALLGLVLLGLVVLAIAMSTKTQICDFFLLECSNSLKPGVAGRGQ